MLPRGFKLFSRTVLFYRNVKCSVQYVDHMTDLIMSASLICVAWPDDIITTCVPAGNLPTSWLWCHSSMTVANHLYPGLQRVNIKHLCSSNLLFVCFSSVHISCVWAHFSPGKLGIISHTHFCILIALLIADIYKNMCKKYVREEEFRVGITPHCDLQAKRGEAVQVITLSTVAQDVRPIWTRNVLRCEHRSWNWKLCHQINHGFVIIFE